MKRFIILCHIMTIVMFANMCYADQINIVKNNADITKNSFFDIIDNKDKMYQLIFKLMDQDKIYIKLLNNNYNSKSHNEKVFDYFGYYLVLKRRRIERSLEYYSPKERRYMLYCFYCGYALAEKIAEKSIPNIKDNSTRKRVKEIKFLFKAYKNRIPTYLESSNYSESEIQKNFQITAKEALPRMIKHAGGMDKLIMH